MTDDMMALKGLVEKTSESDLLRDMISFTAERPYSTREDRTQICDHD